MIRLMLYGGWSLLVVASYIDDGTGLAIFVAGLGLILGGALEAILADIRPKKRREYPD